VVRDGDDLTRQRLVDRREPVETQPADDPPERRALNNEGEEREACGEDAHHALDTVRHAEAFRHCKCECERHRAPQATPEDRDPVGALDRGRELERGQQRQEPEQDHRPRGDGGKDDHADQNEILDTHLLEQPRDQQRGKDEDQRPCPMGQYVPDLTEVRPGLRRQAPGPSQVERQSRGDHGDDARGADALLCADIGEVRQRHGDGDLRQFVTAEQCHRPDRHPCRQPASQSAPGDQHREPRKRLAKVGIGHPQHDEAHEQAEERNGRGVVQQALALDDPGETAWRRD
jgi:hypothetical protein